MASTRPRPPPPPLRLSQPQRPKSALIDHQLLYDLPSASSLRSPSANYDQNGGELTSSPATASRPPSRFSFRPATQAGRALSPPSRSPHGRASPSPGRSIDDELEVFALQCRAWYYDQDEDAGRRMTQTLAGLLPSLRANYARIQAYIRASYHTYLAARRKAEFQAHLSSTVSGGSLAPHSRSHPTSSSARRERAERFERFVKTWCNASMPGTRPFFESLWACMRLQVVPENLGGAGSRRIEWEFDDAVFMESAGKEFMQEAIDVLKGVLGFEEKYASRSPSLRLSDDTVLTQQHSRSQSEPLSAQLLVPSISQKPGKPAQLPHSGRSRAPSDPFLDSNTTSSTSPRSAGSFLEGKGGAGDMTSGVPSPPTSAEIDALLLRTAGGERRYAPSLTSETFDDHAQLRTWTVPDLSNPEFMSLLSFFPSFLTRRTLPRFPVVRASSRCGRRVLDLEETGADVLDEQDEVRVGTGVLRVGSRERTGSWRGNWWERFKMWLRRLFR
ncbi:uncharacterized protein FOMMEDRAFT_122953 [Fomitiporia mediterranea MF3/22]|uniref:uncharacterized protein n=1 Tax=Fomitiporia mediterranea (strain MF3/22) TaxID=694068 RepID=UPI0004409238|nr:uncharacterized protein FOMMEDRAFT_122953 [Fomitiporia mediterranea MF3/22]EJD02873.1 hypothetical protein FOMMEDRAFT_122953 [Fomitiporia mediterranea MF3/22]